MSTSIYVPQAVKDELLLSDVNYIKRRVDIYESDGVTPWLLDAPFTDGNVTIDAGRDERRQFDLTLYTGDGDMPVGPQAGLWYDKIVKVYRGLQYGAGVDWLAPLGVFMIDKINTQYFPNTVTMAGRDLSKKLITSKFGKATMFPEGSSMESVIRTIATNGGISNFVLPATGETLGRDFVFESDVTRKKAIHDICQAYGWTEFFDANGYFTIQEMADPATDPAVFTFDMEGNGAVIDYSKSIGDSRLYNHVVVTGEASTGVSVVAEARNNDPSSSTRISRIGERTYRYTSSFITTVEQAQAVADKFLRYHALEEFSVKITSLVIPWLDAEQIVDFIDPKPTENQPTRFFLHNLTIPLSLSSMVSDVSRVENLAA